MSKYNDFLAEINGLVSHDVARYITTTYKASKAKKSFKYEGDIWKYYVANIKYANFKDRWTVPHYSSITIEFRNESTGMEYILTEKFSSEQHKNNTIPVQKKKIDADIKNMNFEEIIKTNLDRGSYLGSQKSEIK